MQQHIDDQSATYSAKANRAVSEMRNEHIEEASGGKTSG